MAKMKSEEEKEGKKTFNPKAIAKKKVEELEKDTFSYIWFIFIIVLILTTVAFKSYVKEMINISILFMIFFYLEPIMFGVTGRTATTILSRGRDVPVWKRFPLFFLVVIFVYVLYTGIQFALDLAFPEEHVNIVFVLTWLGFLYLMWVFIFSKEREL